MASGKTRDRRDGNFDDDAVTGYIIGRGYRLVSPFFELKGLDTRMGRDIVTRNYLGILTFSDTLAQSSHRSSID